MTVTRVLVSDDHEVVRRGLRSLIESRPGWQVCGETANGRDAVHQVKTLKPEIAILDIGMPELNGIEATRQILREVPETRVLILTMHESEQLVFDCLEAGASGYVLKSEAARDLLDALTAVRAHRSFVSPLSSRVAVGDGKPHVVGGLTAREREIVQLLAEGKSTKEVAAILNISTRTADTHRTNIMRKLDIHSVSELVRFAIRNNLIEP